MAQLHTASRLIIDLRPATSLEPASFCNVAHVIDSLLHSGTRRSVSSAEPASSEMQVCSLADLHVLK